MALKSLGFWMLFLWIQESDGKPTDCGNITGILGEAVTLNCCYSGKDLKSNLFRVQWQLQDYDDDCVVDAYIPGIAPNQCEFYKNRTKLKNNNLQLQLLNVSLEDSKIYECILQKKEKDGFQKIFGGLITLKVAANGSLNATYLDLESPTTNPGTYDGQQQTRVIAISSVLVLIVIIAIIILILYKRKQPLYRAYIAPAGMDKS